MIGQVRDVIRKYVVIQVATMEEDSIFPTDFTGRMHQILGRLRDRSRLRPTNMYSSGKLFLMNEELE